MPSLLHICLTEALESEPVNSPAWSLMQADNYEVLLSQRGRKKEKQALTLGLVELGSGCGSHPGRLYPTGVCGQRAGHAGCRVHRPADVGGREKGPAHQVEPHTPPPTSPIRKTRLHEGRSHLKCMQHFVSVSVQ